MITLKTQSGHLLCLILSVICKFLSIFKSRMKKKSYRSVFRSRSYSFWLLVVLNWKFLVKICSWFKLRWYKNKSDGYFISLNKMWRCLPHINDNITVVVRVIFIPGHSWSKLGDNVITSQRQSSTRDSCQFLLIEFLRQV